MTWQSILTVGIVALAAGYLARRAAAALRSEAAGGCQTCGSCQQGPSTTRPKIDGPRIDVPIETLTAGKPAR